MRYKINYFYLLISFTVLWILINLWYIIFNVYNLNNGGIVDTTTSLQSLLSAFYHQPFVNTVPGGSYFSVHASEILILLLPFFAVWHSFINLYIIQSVLIYSASIPLFLLAQKKLHNDKASFLMAMVFLLNPYTHDNPFETLTLFMGFIIYSYYFFDAKRYIAFGITFLLALSTMEFNPVIGGFFGLYLILLFLYDKIKISSIQNIIKTPVKQFKMVKSHLSELKNFHSYFSIGIILLIISIGFFYGDKYLILYFSHGSHAITSNIAGSNISSFSAIIKDFKTDISSKIDSLMYLNSPFLFLSFLSPFALLELPWFLTYSISTFSPYWNIGVYYDSYIIPFAAISAILGLYKIHSMLGEADRKKVVNRIAYLALIVTLILLVSNVIAPMVTNPVSPVNSNDYGVDQLASLIPGNAKVTTGVNELPIVSSHAYNTWFYGPENNYVLFNITNPPNLNNYGFLAASGSYALYEKGYTGKPELDNLNYSEKAGTYTPGERLSINLLNDRYTPPGNNNISLHLSYSGNDVQTINSNANSSLFLNDSYAMVYPFKLNNSEQLSNIVLDSNMVPGYYILQSMITTSFNGTQLNTSSIISTESYGQNQYNMIDEDFNYKNVQLDSNKTYYLWLWSSGDPGGLTFPVENTTNAHSYIVKIYNGTGTDSYGYSIGKIYSSAEEKLAPRLTFVFNSDRIHKASNIYVSIGGKTTELNVTGNSVYNFSTDETGIYVNSTVLNGTLGVSYTISAVNGREVINPLLQHPYIILGFIFIVSAFVYPVSSFVSRNTNVLNLKLIEISLIISIIVFYSVFTLYYYRLISVDLIYFKIIGIVIAISFFLFILRFNKNKQ